jgi:polar amino acid transport system substrate-binding protein
VDLAREIAARLGRKVRHVECGWASWDEMLNRLDAREVDALISAVTMTEERKRQVAFVEYARDPLVFAARPGSGIRGKADLKGKVVAVQEGTSAHAAAERLQRGGAGFTRIETCRSTPEPFALVREGRADLTLDHGLIARSESRDGTLEVLGPVGQILDPEPLGIALRKDARALRVAIEEALGAMREDGDLARIQDRWTDPERAPPRANK